MLKDSINPKSHAKTFAALLKKERETRTKHAKVFMEAKINELDMGNFYETYDSFDYNPIFVIMTTQGSVPQKVVRITCYLDSKYILPAASTCQGAC